MAGKVNGKSELVGKTIVSEETGRKFGRVGDLSFISETGELMSLLLVEPTTAVRDLTLDRDDRGNMLVPFSSVKSVGDFVIVSEKEIL